MSDEIEIIHHGDVQLLDFGESRTIGPWIKLRLNDPDDLAVFRGMDTASMKKTGHILSCTLAQGDIAELAQEEKPKPKGRHGAFWREMIASGVFRCPPVLEAIGPESAFEDWIRAMPSVISGEFDWDGEKGEGRNQCCHIKVVSEGSGTAEKPPYFAVPMTAAEHAMQHQSGYSAVADLPEGEALEWFRKQAEHYRTEWASKRLAEELAPGAESRSQVNPDVVRCWFADNELEIYLPAKLRTFR